MKIALIGAGYISNFHARAIRSLGHELVMVADRSENLARTFAEKYNCDWTTENEKLLSLNVDLVTVAVPNAYHFEVASTAVNAGHAVLCEKPMTRSVNHARQLVELVNKKGKPFYVGYMKRSHPTVRKYVEFADRIGEMRSGLVRVYHPFALSNWEGIVKSISDNPDRPFDGVFVNSGSHMLDLLLHVAGPVKRVMSARLQYRPGCPTVDTAAHAMLEMENGATVMFECGWLPLTGVGRRENGWDEVLELRGDEGLATLHTTWWDRPEYESPVAEVWHQPTMSKESFNAGAIDYFASEYALIEKALAGEIVPLATAEQASKVDQLIDDIFSAAGATH